MKKSPSYEEAMVRLEEIVTLLEAEETGLDEAMKLFEEGTKLSSLCYNKLSKAEQKIRTFEGTEEGAEIDEGKA